MTNECRKPKSEMRGRFATVGGRCVSSFVIRHSSFVTRHSSFVIHQRRGAVYIAVLGTSLIISLLALSAMMVQRIQNRHLVNSSDVRQAELNAGTAVELALLTMKQSANWRTTQPHGTWFSDRSTGTGTCSVEVTDPIDSSLANNADDAVLVRGIGYSGRAEQRVEVTIDPRKEPLGCLRSAVAAGKLIDVQGGDTLRTGGLITAYQITASSSQVYGSVEAASISGSTYNGTTTQIDAAKLPTMPDWSTVVNYYRTNGTQLNIGSLPTSTPNLGRNVGVENGTTDWTGTPPGIPAATIQQDNSVVHSGSNSLHVKSRDSWTAGAAQRIDDFVKPGQQYTIEGWVNLQSGAAELFQINIHTKGTGGSAQFNSGLPILALRDVWTPITATLTAPSWSGNLEYAFVKIAGGDLFNDKDFNLDDFSIYETTSGRFIHRKVLGPNVNTLYAGAPTNSQGIYWINCTGNRLIIERSRILGTLLVINPGPNSCVADGPISWTPALPGYPALLVDADDAADADFAIYASNRALSESKNGVNFNPAGAPHDQFGQDTDMNDIYQSAIEGLIVIRDDLTYANGPLIRGQVVVGDDIANSSGELEVEFQPDSLLNPPPGFFAPYSYLRRPASARKAVQ